MADINSALYLKSNEPPRVVSPPDAGNLCPRDGIQLIQSKTIEGFKVLECFCGYQWFIKQEGLHDFTPEDMAKDEDLKPNANKIRRPCSDNLVKAVEFLYTDGLEIINITNRLGIDEYTMYKCLDIAGVPRRQKKTRGRRVYKRSVKS